MTVKAVDAGLVFVSQADRDTVSEAFSGEDSEPEDLSWTAEEKRHIAPEERQRVARDVEEYVHYAKNEAKHRTRIMMDDPQTDDPTPLYARRRRSDPTPSWRLENKRNAALESRALQLPAPKKPRTSNDDATAHALQLRRERVGTGADWEFSHEDIKWDLGANGSVVKVGVGAMGPVFKVMRGGLEMAAKVIRDAEHTEASQMLKRELRAMRDLDHENIIKVRGVCLDHSEWVCLLMDLMPRGSLRTLLDTAPELVTGSESMQLKLARGIADGMAYLHGRTPKPMLHHDLKSANVLISESIDGFVPKIADFGLASGTGFTSMMHTMRGAGTFAYEAPECFEDAPFTAACDVYAFSIVVWELLTGKLPWQGKKRAATMRAVCDKGERPPLDPSQTATFVGGLARRCWDQDPAQRPSFKSIKEECAERSKGEAVLITDEPQAERRPDGTVSDIHLPNVGPEATAIKAAFGVRAQRASKISVARLGELLRGKQIWFCPAHGDAMLQGEPVLAFERDGQPEAVSIDTLVNTVRPHVESGQLKLVVLTGCCTSRLAKALHERAGVPDVLAWKTVLADKAARPFGTSLAEVTARQLLHGGRLDPKAAFEAACTAVTTLTEPGTLDNGHAGLVQQFELFVDPKDSTRVLQATGRLITGPGQGRIAAGTPVHVTALPAHGLAWGSGR